MDLQGIGHGTEVIHNSVYGNFESFQRMALDQARVGKRNGGDQHSEVKCKLGSKGGHRG